jgi:cytochrome c peroxidase
MFMTFGKTALSRKGMQILSAFFLLFILGSCNKNNDFTPNVLDLENSKFKNVSRLALTDKELLGKYIYFDASLSATAGQFARGGAMTQSCASCHLPQQGYAGLESQGHANRGNREWGLIPGGFKSGIGEGAVAGVFGGRKPPSASYATFSPILNLPARGKRLNDEYEGGLFWDGRATGSELGNPAAEQARGPFLADKEHNFNTTTGRRDLLMVIKNGSYYPLYKKVWGNDLDMLTADGDPASPLVVKNYNNVAFAIAAYEASSEVNQFSSKYDDVMKKKASFTAEEELGYKLIRSSRTKNCGSSGCHGEKDRDGVPLFTDWGHDNIGLPWKAVYRKEEGLTKGEVDKGFYTTLTSGNLPKGLKINEVNEQIGKFKTPSLRNVARGEGNKRYMHNGIFSSLEEVMHFYNTRDVKGAGWSPSAKADDKTRPDWRPWGAPEYAKTMEGSDELGNFGLSVKEEKAIVAFMRTLSDTRVVLPPAPYAAAAPAPATN